MGRALLAAVLRWARQRGFARVCLWAPVHSAGAIALYRQAGFRETGNRRSLPGNPTLEIVEMQRDLEMAMADRDLFQTMYRAFNSRDIDTVLSAMHPDVAWPNGMEGGVLHGRAAVREYWSRQWRLIDPRVDPMSTAVDEDGRLVVDVHQVVRDLTGNVLKDGLVQHVYTIERGLISAMEIRQPTSSPAPSPVPDQRDHEREDEDEADPRARP